MTIVLTKDHLQALILSLKQYFTERLDQDIGNLKASLVLDFILKGIGPVIYNNAVADTQTRTQETVAELEVHAMSPNSPIGNASPANTLNEFIPLASRYAGSEKWSCPLAS